MEVDARKGVVTFAQMAEWQNLAITDNCPPHDTDDDHVTDAGISFGVLRLSYALRCNKPVIAVAGEVEWTNRNCAMGERMANSGLLPLVSSVIRHPFQGGWRQRNPANWHHAGFC